MSELIKEFGARFLELVFGKKDIPTTMNNIARRNGNDAYYSGVSPESNPYKDAQGTRGQKIREEWDRGYYGK